jgi:hypothetical protein
MQIREHTEALATSFLAKPCHLECPDLANALILSDSEIMEGRIRARPAIETGSRQDLFAKSLDAKRGMACGATMGPETLGNGRDGGHLQEHAKHGQSWCWC